MVWLSAIASGSRCWHEGCLVELRRRGSAVRCGPRSPTKRNEAQLACPGWVYNNRAIVERLWARLKEWRAVATRYEKTAVSFIGVLCLAATLDWLK